MLKSRETVPLNNSRINFSFNKKLYQVLFVWLHNCRRGELTSTLDMMVDLTAISNMKYHSKSLKDNAKPNLKYIRLHLTTLYNPPRVRILQGSTTAKTDKFQERVGILYFFLFTRQKQDFQA